MFNTDIVYLSTKYDEDEDDDESDPDSDTELLKSTTEQSDTNSKIQKIQIIDTMKKNNIHFNMFSEDFIGEYSVLFFNIHMKQIHTFKKIQFFKVEIMDQAGFIIDLTYKIYQFIREDYIHIQKLLHFYGDAEFLFVLYGSEKEDAIYKKIVHIPTKKEIISDTKCTFGKILL